MDSSSLTMVGLIATVLSIIFAFAAFINSRRRMAPKQDQEKDSQPGLPFLAADKQKPGKIQSVASPFYATASRQVSGHEQAKPAFKQVQALGMQSGKNDSLNSDEYLWE